MKILKRDGAYESLSFDKILFRLKKLCNDTSLGVLTRVDFDVIAQKVVGSMYDGVSSAELDEEAARIAMGITDNLEYGELASRIIISNMHKSTKQKFSEVMESLYNNVDTNGEHSPVLADNFIENVRKFADTVDNHIDYSRDYLFHYDGYKRLEKGYLMKIFNKKLNKFEIVERPQHLYMRVAVAIHREDLDSILKTYDYISQHYYTHASPTLFNSGNRLGNLSSCFHEDTVVATLNRGPVKIKDVLVGDSVITHLGNVKKVVQLHKNLLNNRKLYEIDVSKTCKIKVTDNHKLWVIKKDKKTNVKSNKKTKYDIEYIREFLAKDNCELLSTEYKRMKDKLEFKCMCGTICKVSFNDMYYQNIRCNTSECLHKRKYKDNIYSQPQWVDVGKLEEGDFIGIPNKIDNYDKNDLIIDILKFKDLLENKNDQNVNYTVHNDDKTVNLVSSWKVSHTWVKDKMNCKRIHNKVNRFWELNYDFIKFIGIFYGDGHIITGKDVLKKEIIRGVGITIHIDNNELIDFCKRMETFFGVKYKIHKSKNIIQINFHSVLLGEIFNELFGKGFNGKKIWVEMFKWDKNMVKSLVEGLVTTDGCISSNKSMSLQLSNVNFMRDLYYLLRNNNIDCSYGNIKRKKNGTEDHIQLNIPVEEVNISNINKCYTDDRLSQSKYNIKNQYSPIVQNGFKFLRFNKKTQILENLPEYVYTLGVEDDHSYNVGGIIAENCFLLGSFDSLEGIFKTITDVAKISKVGGGIGVHITNIRSKGSLIRKTNGTSDGIVPMLKVYNDVSTYINQCILPDVIVYSKDGPKMMKEVTTNDFLVTLDGTYKKVNEVIINKKDEDVFKIYNYYSSKPLRCTGEHDIYIIRKDVDYPLFIKASEVKEGDLVGFPIIKENGSELKIKTELNKLIVNYDETVDYRVVHLDNENDMYKIKKLFLSLGILVKCRIIEEGYIIKTKKYRCYVPNNHYTTKTLLYTDESSNKVIFTPITKITKEHYSGDVYDFNMIDNHNYLTDMGLVHNSGKRKGSFAIYLEPHHPDILEFLELKKNQGHDDVRARDLFYAVWVSDLFMKKVESDSEWALMCEDQCPGLSDCYGEDYETLYNKYYNEKKYKKIIKAREVWQKILELQIETGVPYIGYKDAVNKKSNQKNIGTIKSSNLCVAPETKILTSNGYETISLLENNEVDVWNGEQFSKTTVVRTGTGQELIKVVLSNSLELECTPYHKFYIYNEQNEVIMVQASDLSPGQRLINSNYPVIESTKDTNLATLLDICNGNDTNYKCITSGSLINIKCTSYELMTSLKYLLNTLGCEPIIKKTSDNYEIYLMTSHLQELYNIGFQHSSINDMTFTLPKKLHVVLVKEVVTTGRISDTFCFTEELRGMGVFNGILTGQCMEISLVSDHKMYQVCNLLSFALPKYIEYDSEGIPFFNHKKLAEIAEYTIGPMNKVIDHNYYPTPETELGNFSTRPLGLGVQGLADVYFKLGIPYDSKEAEKINKEIFETLYYGCIKGSINEAKKDGSYPLYKDSPFSQGKFQFDLASEFDGIDLNNYLSGRWDWDLLKQECSRYGIRNSMLVALMPTASTAQVLNNSDCFEPIDANIYKKRTLSGDQLIMNKYLVNDLDKLGLWSKDMKDLILLHKGSIQQIDNIPKKLKDIYKTCWEISMKAVIKQASDRGVFVDQMQSMNLFISNPTISKLTSAHFFAWKNKLKTGMYYLRSQSSVQAANFGVDATLEKSVREKQELGKELSREEEVLLCSIDNKEACEMCSS